MALVLKSNKVYIGKSLSVNLAAYKERVLADGGIIQNPNSLLEAMLFMQEHKFTDANIFSATSASWGVKIVDGTIVKLYSLFEPSGDIISQSDSVGATLVKDNDGYGISLGNAKMLSSVGFVSTRNLNLFTNFKHDPITESTGIVSSFYAVNNAVNNVVNNEFHKRQVGISISYNHKTRAFAVAGYGSLSALPYTELAGAKSMSASISKEKLQSYINGKIKDVVKDPLVTDSNYYRAHILSLGANPYGDIYRGTVYLNIAGIHLTDEQSCIISKFTEDFR